jgi:hypothetical protein
VRLVAIELNVEGNYREGCTRLILNLGLLSGCRSPRDELFWGRLASMLPRRRFAVAWGVLLQGSGP